MSNIRYFYGNPNNDGDGYMQVMQTFSFHESLNSARTSSLPLAQFWRPNDLGERINQIRGLKEEEVKRALSEPAKRCFEYPTLLPDGCEGKGKPSMTDLMLLSDRYRIAIEAKYTEYLGSGSAYRPLIKDWKKENLKNRTKVLSGWLCHIGDRIEHNDDILDNIPYQLIHRIASACADIGENTAPIVIYHLFFDTSFHDDAQFFANQLLNWANELRLKEVGFHILLTEVRVSSDAINREDDGSLNTIFLDIGKKDFYGSLCSTRLLSR